MPLLAETQGETRAGSGTEDYRRGRNMKTNDVQSADDIVGLLEELDTLMSDLMPDEQNLSTPQTRLTEDILSDLV